MRSLKFLVNLYRAYHKILSKVLNLYCRQDFLPFDGQLKFASYISKEVTEIQIYVWYFKCMLIIIGTTLEFDIINWDRCIELDTRSWNYFLLCKWNPFILPATENILFWCILALPFRILSYGVIEFKNLFARNYLMLCITLATKNDWVFKNV